MTNCDVKLNNYNGTRWQHLPVQVVGEIDSDEDAGGRRVDAHVVHCIVEELRPRVPLNVVGVVVPPTQLYVQPELLGCCAVHRVPEQSELVSRRPSHNIVI